MESHMSKSATARVGVFASADFPKRQAFPQGVGNLTFK